MHWQMLALTHVALYRLSKRKSDKLAQKRERLLELQQRHRATSVDETENADEGTIAPDNGEDETLLMPLDPTLVAEMLALMAELAGAHLHTCVCLG